MNSINNVVSLSGSEIKEIVRESVKEFLVLYEEIEAGVEINSQTKTVSFNSKHEKKIGNYVKIYPTCDTGLIPGVEIWSIFHRNRGALEDDNPLISALKGDGWKINDEDRIIIESHFHCIAEKLSSLCALGITIFIPNESYMNDYISRVISSKGDNVQIIKGLIRKITTEEVHDIVLFDDDCAFRKFYGENFNAAYEQLVDYLQTMDKQKEGVFTRHLIKNKLMLNVLDNTLVGSENPYVRFAKKINGKNLLVIQDTVCRNQSVPKVCQIMQETYAPKSITVIDLLSEVNKSDEFLDNDI